MKIKKIVSAVVLSAMVMASSANVFAAEENVYEYDGIVLKVADRVDITGKERGVNLTYGEGELATGHLGDGKACARAITKTTYDNCTLTAQAFCYDLLDYPTQSPKATGTNVKVVQSGLVSPKNSYGGLFVGQHSITISSGQRYEGGTSTEM